MKRKKYGNYNANGQHGQNSPHANNMRHSQHTPPRVFNPLFRLPQPRPSICQPNFTHPHFRNHRPEHPHQNHQRMKHQQNRGSNNNSPYQRPDKNQRKKLLANNKSQQKTEKREESKSKAIPVQSKDVPESSKSSNQSHELVVVVDSSPEQPSAKKRKVIAIESDDEEIAKEDDKSKSSVEQPEASSSSKNSHSNKEKIIASTSESLPDKYKSHLTSAAWKYYEKNRQNKASFDRKCVLRDGIQTLIVENFGKEGVLHLTGSSMTGFGTMTSDADMALVFDPNLNTISKKKARNVITRLASCLRRQAFCANVEMIFAKVPIVKFFDRISECDVDININNTVGIKNSFLLKSISLVDERIPPLIIFVKAWAKAQDINSAFMGTLSSYLLVSMVIYFLQTGISPPLLPPLRQYVDNLQSVNVNTQLQTLQPAQFIKLQVRNQETLGEVLAKFFLFWNKKLKQNKVFSVYTAQEKIRTYNEPFLDTGAYVFCVEEPFLKDNIARAVRGEKFKTVKQKFHQACFKLKDIATFDELFEE